MEELLLQLRILSAEKLLISGHCLLLLVLQLHLEMLQMIDFAAFATAAQRQRSFAVENLLIDVRGGRGGDGGRRFLDFQSRVFDVAVDFGVFEFEIRVLDVVHE